jgi:uncharacterized protein YqgC (DUF456 family)
MIGQYILWTVVIALFLIGLAGTILPVVPGSLLIFAGALIYGIFTQFEEITFWVLATLAVLSVGAQVLDYAAEAYGAKRFGATKYGIWGAIIGGIVGLMILNILGLVLGIIFGAVIPEVIWGGRDLKGALKTGWGSLLGFFGGTLMKFVLGLISIGIFFMALTSCSPG